MARKLSAKCVCVEAFTHVIEASVLEIRSIGGPRTPTRESRHLKSVSSMS
jgi:hypothetical protein